MVGLTLPTHLRHLSSHVQLARFRRVSERRQSGYAYTHSTSAMDEIGITVGGAGLDHKRQQERPQLLSRSSSVLKHANPQPDRHVLDPESTVYTWTCPSVALALLHGLEHAVLLLCVFTRLDDVGVGWLSRGDREALLIVTGATCGAAVLLSFVYLARFSALPAKV